MTDRDSLALANILRVAMDDCGHQQAREVYECIVGLIDRAVADRQLSAPAGEFGVMLAALSCRVRPR